MSQETKIEWTEATLNFVAGCDKISPGCKNCYAIKEAWRLSHNPNSKVSLPYLATVEKQGNLINWTGQISLIADRLEKPFTIAKSTKFFVNSMTDLFHDNVSIEIIDKFLAVVALTPQHTYQVLTKRPERMKQYFRDYKLYRRVLDAANEFRLKHNRLYNIGISNPSIFPLTNLWLGISAENQATFDQRITYLINTPASTRFVSFEPLLEKVNFTTDHENDHLTKIKIDWAIVGGESGFSARPMNEDWVRSLRDQCLENGVKFFYKQKIENKKKISLPVLDGRQWAEIPGMEDTK